MVRRAEVQSINVPGAAAVPWRLGDSVPQSRPAIAVAAEAIVGFVLEPGGGTTPHLRGGSFNAARTLGRLGLRPVFIGRVSRARYGRALGDALEQSGVSLDGVVATDDPTTFARIEIDEYGAARCRFHIEGTSMAGLLPEEARAAMPDRAADRLGHSARREGGCGVVLRMMSGSGPGRRRC
jgi:sugar/nucleoside kinase (ribokinase family)